MPGDLSDFKSFPPTVEPVEIELGDGKKRELRYTVRTLQRMKASIGRAMLGPGGGLMGLDEDVLPELIWHGLHDKAGNPPDISVAELTDLPAAAIPYMMNAFVRAYSGSLPQKKADAAINLVQ